jgi:hypothetical protein
MADTCVVDLDTDFMRSRRSDLDVFDGQVLAGFPGNRGLFQSARCYWSFSSRGGLVSIPLLQILACALRVCIRVSRIQL